MEVVITIFKEQLEGRSHLKPQLAKLSVEVKEISMALLYLPRDEDSLAEFISLLNESKISFGVHLPGEDLPEVIRWNGGNKRGSLE